MDTKKLRQKILDLAIHGKLVPQDPNDEPASVLLERIRAEKEKLIKEGKIKAPKKSKSAGDTSHYPKDVPFEVPEGWCWTTIGDCLINRDGERIPISSEIRIKQKNKVFDYYGAAGVIDKVDDYLFNERLLLIGEDGANLLSRAKDNAFFADGKYWVNNHAHILDATRKPLLDYIALYINSIALDPYITGSAQPKLNQDNLNRIPVPLPPFMEQLRIIDSMAKSQVIIDIIAEKQKEIVNAISLAKSKILDLAIHGKLVPQDPSDEPAIELLKRINPDFVPSDNLHYEAVLPDGWTLVQLSSICSTINGLWKGTKEPLVKVGVIRNANFTKDFTLDYSKIEYINVELKSFAKRNLEDGDIIVEKSGGSDNFPVGRSILYLGENNVYSFSNFTMSLRITDKQKILPKYLFYVLQHRYRRGDMKQMQTQTTGLHNLLTDIYLSILIPIPPVREQKRIVEAIEDSFRVIDGGIRDIVNDTK